MRIPFKRTCCFMLCLLLWGSALFVSADQVLSAERFYARQESVSGLVNVPGVEEPMRYYAQNDALWENLVYERKGVKKVRPFKDSGCSPSALAMAVCHLIPDEELSQISQYARKEYSLCICAINEDICDRHRGRYVITSQRDYVRFLPLILADFACGNNTFGVYSRSAAQGTGTAYIQKVCEVYGLECRFTYSYDEALTAIANENQAVMALAGAGGCFTNNGHYLFLANADEERLYVLDSLCREQYKTNKASVIEIIQPGVVSLLHKDVRHAQFSNFVILTKPVNNADIP